MSFVVTFKGSPRLYKDGVEDKCPKDARFDTVRTKRSDTLIDHKDAYNMQIL